MKSSDFVLNEIALYLEQHEQSLRIRKLMFLACKDYWENDADILNTFLFKYLILELCELNPNMEQLKISMNRLVNTLSRKDVYSAVVKIIINQVEQFYQNPDASAKITQVQAKSLNQVSPHSKLDKVVRKLEENKDVVRIKKLIFTATKKRWPTKSDPLEKLPLKNLILELRQIYPSLEGIKKGLDNVVKTLSKQQLYSHIAKTIISELDDLYYHKANTSSSNSQNKNNSHQNGPTVILPGFLERHQLNENDNFSETPTAIPSDSNDDITHIKTNLTEEVALPQQEEKQEETKLTQQPQPQPQPQPQQQLQPEPQPQTQLNYNRFDLRAQVMKFTNPLAAKILVFSIVYHRFDIGGQDWPMLQTHNLDELLETLFQQYPTIAELEDKLYDTANSLQHSERYLEPAGAIVQSIRPFYQ